jgi:hypothetical protein
MLCRAGTSGIGLVFSVAFIFFFFLVLVLVLVFFFRQRLFTSGKAISASLYLMSIQKE